MLTFATVAINARALGAEGLGIITLIQAYAALVTGLFSFGTQQPVIRLAAQAQSDNQEREIGRIITLGMAIDSVGAIMAGTVGLALLTTFIGGTKTIDDNMVFIGLFVSTIYLTGTNTINGVFRFFNRFHYVSLLTVVSAALYFLGSIILFTITAELSAYILMYAVAQSLSSIAYFVVGFMVLRAHSVKLTFEGRAMFGATDFPVFLQYIWTTWATSIINSMRLRSDVLILALFSGPATVGIYGVARQLSGVLNKVTQALSSAVFPEVAHLATVDDKATARHLLVRLAVGGALVGLAMVTFSMFFGDDLLRIGFGEDFEEGAPALTLLVCASSFMLSSAAFGGFIQAFVSPRRLFSVYLAGIIPFVACLLLIIHGWGMIGAAIAQNAFAITVWTISIAILRKRLGN